MSSRERMLALAVGALVALAGVFYVYRYVEGSFQQRRQVLERLEGEAKRKERQVFLGRIAEQRLKRYQERSLPPDPELASQLYTKWLLSALTRLGFHEPKVSLTQTGLRSQAEAYQAAAFSVSGVGDLEKLTRLLYDFYAAGYLHRIKSLTVTPRDRKTIAFTMTVEALSLSDAAPRDELPAPPSPGLAGGDLEAYLQAIAGRNLFGPPNNPPRLTVRAESATAGRPVTISPSASDPDEGDKLTYAWESQEIADASFDPATGRLTWTPSRPGEYAVTILARDDGVPARTARETVRIRVAEAAPPAAPPKENKPPYDQVRFTYVNGITEVNGQRQVWMIDRPSGKNYWLQEGDQFQVGQFQAEVKHIGPLDVEFQWYGRRAVVRLGENLGEDRELEEGELINLRREEQAF